jgi:hypothetical protein
MKKGEFMQNPGNKRSRAVLPLALPGIPVPGVALLPIVDYYLNKPKDPKSDKPRKKHKYAKQQAPHPHVAAVVPAQAAFAAQQPVIPTQAIAVQQRLVQDFAGRQRAPAQVSIPPQMNAETTFGMLFAYSQTLMPRDRARFYTHIFDLQNCQLRLNNILRKLADQDLPRGEEFPLRRFLIFMDYLIGGNELIPSFSNSLNEKTTMTGLCRLLSFYPFQLNFMDAMIPEAPSLPQSLTDQAHDHRALPMVVEEEKFAARPFSIAASTENSPSPATSQGSRASSQSPIPERAAVAPSRLVVLLKN